MKIDFLAEALGARRADELGGLTHDQVVELVHGPVKRGKSAFESNEVRRYAYEDNSAVLHAMAREVGKVRPWGWTRYENRARWGAWRTRSDRRGLNMDGSPRLPQ